MLCVWLPLNGDLHNQGASDYVITSTDSSLTASGKIGSCMKITSSMSLGYIPNFNTTPLSFGGWFKFNQAEISAKVNALTYSSTANYPTGNLLGNTSYGGIGLIWAGNNHYTSGAFNSMTIFATLRTATVNQSTSAFTVEFDKWIHIILTWDPNSHILSLYKDGILINSKTLNAFADGASRVLQLNWSAVYGGNGPGVSIPIYCNDIRIYDHCLSAAEVKEISQGLVLHYKLDGGILGNPNLLLNTHFDTRYSQTTGWNTTKNGTLLANNWGGYNSGVANASTCYHAHLKQLDNEYVYEYIKESETWLGISQGGLQSRLTAGKTYTFSCEQYSVTNTNYMTAGLYYFKTGATSANFHLGQMSCNSNRIQGTWQKFTYTFTAPSDGDYSKNMSWYCYGHSGGAGAFYLRHLKLEEGFVATPWAPTTAEANYDRSIIEDSSGYGHHGTVINSPQCQNDTARYNTSINFNENADSITINPFLTLNQTINTITVSCWFKTNTLNSTAPNIFSLGENSFLRCRIASASSIWSYYRVASTQVSDTYSCKTLTDNAWHLLTFVFDTGIEKVYIDGAQIGTTDRSSTGTYLTCSSVAWHLAGYTATAESFLGSLSDFRIYCTALSADDILQLYHTSTKVDNKQNLHTFELIESNSTIQVNRRGQTLCNGLQENVATKFYQTNQIIETNEIIEL